MTKLERMRQIARDAIQTRRQARFQVRAVGGVDRVRIRLIANTSGDPNALREGQETEVSPTDAKFLISRGLAKHV